MKVPFPPANNHNSSKTALSSTPTTTLPAASATTTTAASSPYEPKSVLELRSSPSPVSDHKPASNNTCAADLLLADDPLQLDQDHHMLINPQEWDSWMRELGLHDDSTTPVSKQLTSHSDQSHQNHYSNDLLEFPPVISSLDSNHDHSNWNVVGFDYVDELIRLAECFETNSLQLGQVILARLNQRLRSPIGKPLQRAAFYFKEALQSLLTGSARLAHQPANSSEIIQTIKAQKTFSNISPIPMFSSFTANQALLEAIDGSSQVHIIDFDIGFGGHWASFMKELADKADSRKAAPPVIRISALVPEEYAAESRLIRENLSQFARELNIRFEIDFILIRTFEYLSFKAIKFMDGERVAVLLTPAIFRHVGTGFLNDLRRASPHVVVHIDVEGQMGYGAPSYRQAVIDGLEFYSTLLESMEAANFNVAGGGGDWMRRIETFVLYPKIVEGIQAASRRGTAWREALVAAGLRQVGLSQFADFQAECLLRRVQVRGFHVVKRQAEMLLCWHDRPLVATSAWRF
ncbi:Scarecrow-like protein 15 [Sesamum angolense]|uniref:Scarecrow-like protein 15 n=1 Tax=Sesamum angolense TaxID=2727404 RepID=A0AAE1XEA0_9LAMI|nr:Scarecrow-like protein 15 [Sesamum angolense]